MTLEELLKTELLNKIQLSKLIEKIGADNFFNYINANLKFNGYYYHIYEFNQQFINLVGPHILIKNSLQKKFILRNIYNYINDNIVIITRMYLNKEYAAIKSKNFKFENFEILTESFGFNVTLFEYDFSIYIKFNEIDKNKNNNNLPYRISSDTLNIGVYNVYSVNKILSIKEIIKTLIDTVFYQSVAYLLNQNLNIYKNYIYDCCTDQIVDLLNLSEAEKYCIKNLI